MRKRRNLTIVLGIVTVVGACFLICGNIRPIVDYLCRQDTSIAELDAGNNRIIAISGASCWEIGRTLYYQVTDHGTVIASKHLFDGDNGSTRHTYTLIYADNQSVVGVLETTVLPSELVIIVDFRTGQSWPRTPYGAWRNRIERLQQENPQVEILTFFEQEVNS